MMLLTPANGLFIVLITPEICVWANATWINLFQPIFAYSFKLQEFGNPNSLGRRFLSAVLGTGALSMPAPAINWRKIGQRLSLCFPLQCALPVFAEESDLVGHVSSPVAVVGGTLCQPAQAPI